jgi:hypothetical protein
MAELTDIREAVRERYANAAKATAAGAYGQARRWKRRRTAAALMELRVAPPTRRAYSERVCMPKSCARTYPMRP